MPPQSIDDASDVELGHPPQRMLPPLPDAPSPSHQQDDSKRQFTILNAAANEQYGFCDNSVTTSKYSFIPIRLNFVVWKNLFEQFHKAANIYFLLISALQLIPGLSPTGRFTTLGPLVLVLSVTMAKDTFEDVKRHRSDRDLNRCHAQVWRDNRWTAVEWREVLVGDLCRVRKGEPFPADLILIWSNNNEGIAYIETASLDGETNLKIRKSPQAICRLYSPQSPDTIPGRVTCELPNNRLNNFDGFFETTNAKNVVKVPLQADNILLRGALLRNTNEAVGVVVFTGADTKLMRNSCAKTSKLSHIDHITNTQVLYMFIAEVVLAISCTIGSAFTIPAESDHWYLPSTTAASGRFLQIVQALGTFVILYNNLIPISLYVTMEIVKLLQAFFINNDCRMYHEETDTPAMARTSSLNEELGQVEYIFSDKTGTLTCNMMDFRKFTCTCYNQMHPYVATFGEGSSNDGASPVLPQVKGFQFYDPEVSNAAWQSHPESASIRFFLSFLAVCHAVIPERDENDEIIYQAASPDEDCLVRAARELGVVFHSRTETQVVIEVLGRLEEWNIFNVIEFDSSRKRMSVVCEDPNGQLMLLCKGADTVIYERLRKAPESQQAHCDTLTKLTEFAAEGLRTLVLAKVDLDPAWYTEWNKKYHTASIEIHNRASKMAAVAEEIEKEMELVGTTAIEDKLQLGVPQTIQLLSNAGIKIWVLTGDKQETAINIGFACSLLNDEMGLFVFTGCDDSNLSSVLKCYLADARQVQNQDLGLVIEGGVLEHVLPFSGEADEVEKEKHALTEREEIFLSLATRCRAVICCRVSPLQKAAVVNLVKHNMQTVTLAIGDGANDVSMIQAAHVGVGISGLEGLQAARASDYSIAQFRFLQRLLLVHGRYNYRRVSKLILYCFYKNICLYLTQFWFALFNRFTGQSLYDQWALSLYNVIFTFFPIIALGALDRDVPENRLLERGQFPELYADGLHNTLFNTMTFWKFTANSTIHSVLCFLLPLFITRDLVNASGQALGLTVTGLTAYTTILWVITGKLAFETQSWTLVNVAVVSTSLVAWYLFLLVYGIMYNGVRLADLANWYGTPAQTLGHPTHWLCVLVGAVLPMVREVSWKAWRHNWSQELRHVVQYLESENKPFQREDISRYAPTLQSQNMRQLRFFTPDRESTGGMFLDFDFFPLPHKLRQMFDSIVQTNSTRDHFSSGMAREGSRRRRDGARAPAAPYSEEKAAKALPTNRAGPAAFFSQPGHTKVKDVVFDDL